MQQVSRNVFKWINKRINKIFTFDKENFVREKEVF